MKCHFRTEHVAQGVVFAVAHTKPRFDPQSYCINQAHWCTAIILALRRQEGQAFRFVLSSIVNLRL